jgi:hypothetical protein
MDIQVRIEKVGGYLLHQDVGVNLFRMVAEDRCDGPLPEDKEDVRELFMYTTGHVPAGSNGPGRWFTSRVNVVYVDDCYDYALIEVVRALDV